MNEQDKERLREWREMQQLHTPPYLKNLAGGMHGEVAAVVDRLLESACEIAITEIELGLTLHDWNYVSAGISYLKTLRSHQKARRGR